ncbi:MAG: superoxide dismutase [Chloroflexi bacterium]|nr:superoxide dismutase [Chloroflexota bacterium]
MPWQAKPLPYKSLNGLSERQIAEHYKLYEGYVKKFNEIETKLNNVNWSDANSTYSEVRELKIEESFALNAIKLHEGYFFSFGGNGQPSGNAVKLIEMDYGSIDGWKNQMFAEGVAARGWVVCAYDWSRACVENFVCDAHNLYNIWNATPLVILDVYEHAYFADYGTSRKEYISAWWNNLNWDIIGSVVAESEMISHRERGRKAA